MFKVLFAVFWCCAGATEPSVGLDLQEDARGGGRPEDDVTLLEI